ncbi:hypothetical protein QFC21_004538 [Naganishia friedmannii]|uniref:Uncharacterized protein n=1 Tax=Naganishia friedmannii TaxID=89922 RepID=A0ACC2VGC1_9TREE|nr:hypothetical protein QFC21_004538 [Naganishia friedmannii]
MSFEPHFTHHRRTSVENKSFDDPLASASSILAELDKIAPIKAFDAFPKVQPTYTTSSRRGGILTAILGAVIFLLVLNDLGEYLYGQPGYEFHVENTIDTTELQMNVDITVAMPCHYLSIDLRDVVGDRLHFSDDFVKDGTTFDTARTTSSQSGTSTAPSIRQVINDARRSASPRYRQQPSSFSGLRSLFSSPFSGSRKAHKQPAFRPTLNKLPADGPDAGPACRMYGSVGVKKVTANLHVTTLGHGYMSWEHTDHTLMNLSHIIHEFSFGPYFPAIAQPLDMTYTITDSRIFFKFDLEALGMTIRERTTSLYQFFIRLAGVIDAKYRPTPTLCFHWDISISLGGVWTTASFALRVLTRAEKEVKTKLKVGSTSDDSFASSEGGNAFLPTPGGLPGNGVGGNRYSPSVGYAGQAMGTPNGGVGMLHRNAGSYF